MGQPGKPYVSSKWFFCSCCLIVTVLQNYQLFCSEIFRVWGFWRGFAGNASQESKKSTPWTLHVIWGEELCYFYKSIQSKLYEYSYSKHRFTATFSHSVMSDPPPHANAVEISLAWVQLPLSSLICQCILLIEGKRSGYSLK